MLIFFRSSHDELVFEFLLTIKYEFFLLPRQDSREYFHRKEKTDNDNENNENLTKKSFEENPMSFSPENRSQSSPAKIDESFKGRKSVLRKYKRKRTRQQISENVVTGSVLSNGE